ncbi:uncharacterized protein OCT59_009381 [Rhizophagus irregularis]|uniref:uncharacterized protein n=1 Tax=Rhizophagus irregularis TaxID=588596 RepID=UPI00333459C8|nr:hypothetical protein OCT59_009381 [Rhizophagus irregularis]
METRRSISSLSTESRLSEVTSAEASNSTRIDDEKKKDESRNFVFTFFYQFFIKSQEYKSVLENDETSEAEERTLAIEERKLVIREQMAKVCFKMANIENEQEARKERTLAIEERKLVIREQTAKVRKEQEARTIKETLTLQKKQRKYTFHLFPF